MRVGRGKKYIGLGVGAWVSQAKVGGLGTNVMALAKCYAMVNLLVCWDTRAQRDTHQPNTYQILGKLSNFT